MTRPIHSTEGQSSAHHPIARRGAPRDPDELASGADPETPSSPFQALFQSVQVERPRTSSAGPPGKEPGRRAENHHPKAALGLTSFPMAQAVTPLRSPDLRSSDAPTTSRASQPVDGTGAGRGPASSVQPGGTVDSIGPGDPTRRDGPSGQAVPAEEQAPPSAMGAEVVPAVEAHSEGKGKAGQEAPATTPIESAIGETASAGRASSAPHPTPIPSPTTLHSNATPPAGPPTSHRSQTTAPPSNLSQTSLAPASSTSSTETGVAPAGLTAPAADGLSSLTSDSPDAPDSADPRDSSSRDDLDASPSALADPTLAPPLAPFAAVGATSGAIPSGSGAVAASVPTQVLAYVSGHAFPRGDTTLVMRLTPPELGSVVLRVQSRDGQRLRLRFEVEHATTGDALLRGKEQIESVLRGRGLAPDGFAVDLSGTPPDQSGAAGSFGWSASGSGTGAFSDGADSDDRERQARSPRMAPTSRGAIDAASSPSSAALVPGGRLVDYRL